jgi:hypothetical protein
VSIYDLMRDTVQWESFLGEGDAPGEETFAEAAALAPARRIETVAVVGGDRTANLVVWVMPDSGVKEQDRLDGADVLETGVIRGPESEPQVLVCYARR